MQRRHFIAAAGAGLAGAVANSAFGQSDALSKSSSMQQCATECYDCAQECDTCAAHCADMLAKGKHDHLATLRSCADCSDICRAAGAASARGGVHAALICKACGDVCEACATSCEKHPDNEVMTRCAKACRDCATECKNMVKHAVHV